MTETFPTDPTQLAPQAHTGNFQPTAITDPLNDQYPGLVAAIPDEGLRNGFVERIMEFPESQREGFAQGVVDLPANLQASYYTRMGHTMNEADPVVAETSREGVLFELRRIGQVQTSGLEKIDFEAGKDIGDVTFTGYSKKADLSGRPDKEMTSAIDCDIPISRDGQTHVYEVKKYPRMAFGGDAKKRNQLLKYQQAISDGSVEGATVELKGRIDPSFIEWAAGKEGEAGMVPDVEVLHTIDLPSGLEYTTVLKPGMPGKGLRYENAAPMDETDQKVIDGIKAAEADGTLATLLTTEDVDFAPEDLRPYIENPMSIKSTEVLQQYEAYMRATLYDRCVAKAEAQHTSQFVGSLALQ